LDDEFDDTSAERPDEYTFEENKVEERVVDDGWPF
jgi:hypothetical protein